MTRSRLRQFLRKLCQRLMAGAMLDAEACREAGLELDRLLVEWEAERKAWKRQRASANEVLDQEASEFLDEVSLYLDGAP